MLKFTSEKELSITFTSLIIRVESLKRNGMSLNEFCTKHNLWGKTNGELWVISSMQTPSAELENVITKSLIPNGLEESRDYVQLIEQLTEGVNRPYAFDVLESGEHHKEEINVLGKPIPGSEKIPWLITEIRKDGNWAWKAEKVKTSCNFRDEYYKSFERLSDQEIVQRFNGQVQVPAWNVARSGYLWALRDSLESRKIDYSSCGNKKSMSYRNCVVLKSKKLYRVVDLPIEEIQKLLETWAERSRPGILIDLPLVYDINRNNDEIRVRSGVPGFGIRMNLKIKELIS